MNLKERARYCQLKMMHALAERCLQVVAVAHLLWELNMRCHKDLGMKGHHLLMKCKR